MNGFGEPSCSLSDAREHEESCVLWCLFLFAQGHVVDRLLYDSALRLSEPASLGYVSFAGHLVKECQISVDWILFAHACVG
eukprot:6093826-Amphidinium_carterae.2